MTAKSKNTELQTVLITGVTGAVGGAVALKIATSGARTLLMARNPEKLETLTKSLTATTGNKNIEFVTADFSDISSVKKAAKEVIKKHDSLNGLLNVAAVFKSKRELSKDGLEMMYAVNHVAPYILTNALLGLIKKSLNGRIINVTAPSTTKLDFENLQGDKKFSALKSFGASKMANLLFTYALAKRFEGSKVSAMAYFPGLVKSDLMREMPPVISGLFKLMSNPADKATVTLAKMCLDPEFEHTNGKFFKFNGAELKSSPYSYDPDIQEKLWKITEDY